jgi:putative ABC transport system permease protein
VNALQIVLVAVRALLRNKMRSILTALGVVIGVAAVVAMTSIGAGARARVQQTFESMGTNLLIVRSGSSQTGGVRGGAGSQPTLTFDDLAAIEQQLPDVESVAPVLVKPVQLVAEGQNWASAAQGTTPALFKLRNWSVGLGTFFGPEDVARGAKVAVLGATVAENLFGAYANPVGQLVRVDNVPFEVVGVAARKGPSLFGSDQDDVVFVPLSTFRARLQGGLGQFLDGTLFVGARPSAGTEAVEKEITQLLRVQHRLRPGEPDDFTVRNLGEISAAQQEGARTLTSLLAGIALVSLVVGGIGIMNIMLVSVKERTREIGLRMAVGAKPRNVLAQFLVESVTLSTIGGLLGVAVGLGAAAALAARFDWPVLVQPAVVAIALVSSAVVGVGFGLYPAYQASRLDPIQALRYE